MHKRSHTIAAVAAVAAATGGRWGEKTVAGGARGFASLLVWARGLEGERVWALEDCRHVSGSLERFLIERGERVRAVARRPEERYDSVADLLAALERLRADERRRGLDPRRLSLDDRAALGCGRARYPESRRRQRNPEQQGAA